MQAPHARSVRRICGVKGRIVVAKDCSFLSGTFTAADVAAALTDTRALIESVGRNNAENIDTEKLAEIMIESFTQGL